jgi:hypothetical protein
MSITDNVLIFDNSEGKHELIAKKANPVEQRFADGNTKTVTRLCCLRYM